MKFKEGDPTYELYLELEERIKRELPELDRLINKLEQEWLLLEEGKELGNSEYSLSVLKH
jgi:hypothetical protein